jgi:hypothetical protein
MVVAEKKKQAVQNQKSNIMHTYYRIDQEELEKKSLGHKSELDHESGGLTDVYQFSMLQRFRRNCDFKAPDRYKPKNVDEIQEIRENESMLKGSIRTEEQKKEEKQSKKEKGRYIQALKVLVKENG